MDEFSAEPDSLQERLRALLPLAFLTIFACVWLAANAFPTISAAYLDILIIWLVYIIIWIDKTGILINLSILFLGITIPIFVLTVTLLGRATKISKELQSSSEEKTKKEYDVRISHLQDQIATNPGDLKALETEVGQLRTKTLASERRIGNINRKYRALGLKDAVLFPSFGFVISIILQKTAVSVIGPRFEVFLFTVAIAGFVYGLLKIYKTLSVVQEVSLRADGDQLKELREMLVTTLQLETAQKESVPYELRESLVAALREIDKQKEPQPIINFQKTPPFVASVNEVLEIPFYVSLAKDGNVEAKNLEALFIVPPEIDILKGSAYSTFTQRPTYQIPNAKSAKFKFDKTDKHTYTGGILKLTPTIAGIYRFRYKIACDGHAEPAKETTIIVTE